MLRGDAAGSFEVRRVLTVDPSSVVDGGRGRVQRSTSMGTDRRIFAAYVLRCCRQCGRAAAAAVAAKGVAAPHDSSVRVRRNAALRRGPVGHRAPQRPVRPTSRRHASRRDHQPDANQVWDSFNPYIPNGEATSTASTRPAARRCSTSTSRQGEIITWLASGYELQPRIHRVHPRR